ncbi:S-adenosyl-L-methionine-dependent methyltransferase [Paraphysoderma sedebokerense]|nr:S-adenosyl-L-methionine-dependent methyltransferase [Paraphysoderma sedebokerense]
MYRHCHIEQMPTEIRALEFFSGIGGMHYGFLYTNTPGKVVARFDMNLNANRVYKHNFGEEPITLGVEHLTVDQIAAYRANTFFMSPPCQPFTRGGKCLDDKDERSAGLLHLIEVIKLLPNAPKYVFLENVLNFEKSNCRRILVQTLGDLGYDIKECLLNPLQFGIPNGRLRYYLIARRKQNYRIHSKIPYLKNCVIHQSWPLNFNSTSDESSAVSDVAHLNKYLDPSVPIADYLVPQGWITKRKGFRFDIVQPTDNRCSTFTKAYGTHHVFGSGSYLQTENLDIEHDYTCHEVLLTLKLRLFTPTEVAKLHHFPVLGTFLEDSCGGKTLEFPPETTTLQKYRLLGNSMNVKVVGELMKILFFDICKE